KKIVRTAELISSRGQRVRFEMGRPIVIYARTVLNGLLLDRATPPGCKTVRSRITSVDTADDRVRLGLAGREHAADFAVLAAGARNQLLPGTTPLRPADLEMTLGYFIPAEDEILKIKFLQGHEGYLWSFPRADHLSVGICGKMAQNSSQQLRHHLENFVSEERIPLEGAKFYSHVLPSPQAQTIRRRRIAGRNWAMAGDAAACVDPVTGEGLFYALRSGDLLAQALIEAQPETYPERLRTAFSADL